MLAVSIAGFHNLKNSPYLLHRPQRRQDSKHLATIEAIYYFFREMNELIDGRSYSGIYDNLLYFYAYQYGVVQQAQKERLEEL